MLTKSSTDLLKKIIGKLSLSKEHALIYVTNLELGPSPASRIAKKAKLPRATTYDRLNDLIKKGLTSVVKGDTRKVYTATNPNHLKSLLNDQYQEIKKDLFSLEEHISEIQSAYHSTLPNFPKVEFYEGEDGLRRVEYDQLSAEEVLIICNGDPENSKLDDDPSYLADTIREFDIRKTRIKAIVERSGSNIEYKQKYESDLQEILIIPRTSKTDNNHLDKHIYNDKVSYISHNDNIGIIIQNMIIAEYERKQFNALWDHYKASTIS